MHRPQHSYQLVTKCTGSYQCLKHTVMCTYASSPPKLLSPPPTILGISTKYKDKNGAHRTYYWSFACRNTSTRNSSRNEWQG